MNMTPNIAFVVAVTEYERGWGSRPDGVIAFRSEDDADSFLSDIYTSRSRELLVPDEYLGYDKLGYREVKATVIEELNKNIKFIKYNNASECLK